MHRAPPLDAAEDPLTHTGKNAIDDPGSNGHVELQVRSPQAAIKPSSSGVTQSAEDPYFILGFLYKSQTHLNLATNYGGRRPHR